AGSGATPAAVDGVEPSMVVAERVRRAWERQLERQGSANGELRVAPHEPILGAAPGVLDRLERRGRRFKLAPRRLHRAMRIARTIADLDGRDAITGPDVDEALLYRPELAA
ncbi:MAG TPA: ATP-dependent protease, partial [Candidatus Limnocylindria bacterium]